MSNDFTIKTHVGGRKFVITQDRLHDILGLPIHEPTITLHEKVILLRNGSKNYVNVLDMYILKALKRDIHISLLHIIISHMTSSYSTDRHLSYAHLLTHFFDEASVDLNMGGAPLSMKETVGSATLHAMMFRYVHLERRWIWLVDIPAGVEYGRYKSPHDSN
ncbi:hypothetical protein Scep_021392 [Stephania cephalantha]|uniref:Uncharacterized protein n=1 Tax=Stephania cephalantha TaxID=152367 RepID=A0AAP0HWT8_9MAGN